MEILTDEDIGGLEWGETPGKSYFADFRFVDKYPKEVNCLLEAQNRKTLERVIKDLIQINKERRLLSSCLANYIQSLREEVKK